MHPPAPPINVQPKPAGGDSSFRLLLIKPGGTFHEIPDSLHCQGKTRRAYMIAKEAPLCEPIMAHGSG
ncbi:MAG: hypothetical protein L0Y68_03410 [Candidatus Dadabacteria bacterium]|nr:hypothetical protein [Candidatus Dadabacteria bacterium]